MAVYTLQCNGCGTTVHVGSTNPEHPEYDLNAAAQLAAPDLAVKCPPDSGCCQKPGCAHTSECDQAHDGGCAVENPDCGVCKTLTITAHEGAAVLVSHGS